MVPFLTALRPPSLIVMFGWFIIIFPVKFSSVCVRIHGWSYPQVLLERRSEELGSSVDWRFHFFIGICHSFWRRRWSHRCSVQVWQMQIRSNLFVKKVAYSHSQVTLLSSHRREIEIWILGRIYIPFFLIVHIFALRQIDFCRYMILLRAWVSVPRFAVKYV